MYKDFKEILKHTSVYSLGNLLNKVIGFLLIPVYTRYLSPSDYGTIELLDITVTLVGIFLKMGIYSAVLRFYSLYDTKREKDSVISTAMIFLLGISLISNGLCFTRSEFISNLIFKSANYSYFFQLTFITLFFNISIAIPEIYILARKKSLFYITLSTITLAINLILNITFIVFMNLGILGVLYSSLISRVVTSIVLYVYILREIGIQFCLAKLKGMLLYGLPLVPDLLNDLLTSSSNRYFLNHYCSLESVGLFSLGFKFAFMINFLLLQPFLGIWFPKMFELYKRENAREIYGKLFTYMFLGISLATFILSVLIEDILKVVATPPFYGAYKIVPLLAIGYLFKANFIFFKTGFYIEKKTKYIPILSVFLLCANLLLNFFFVSRLDIVGAAMATVLTFMFGSILAYVMSQKLYRINYEFGRCLKVLGVGIVLYLISNISISENVYFSLIIKILIILSFPFALYVTRFFNTQENIKLKEIVWGSFNKRWTTLYKSWTG